MLVIGIIIQQELFNVKDTIEINKYLIYCLTQISEKYKLVSTINNGFDRDIFNFCTEKLIPYRCFNVKWKEHGKTALYVRTDMFVNFCNIIFILKNNDDIETDYIKEVCKKTNKQYVEINADSFKKL